MIKTKTDAPAVQFIRTPSGDELAVLPRADYEALARAAGPAVGRVNAGRRAEGALSDMTLQAPAEAVQTAIGNDDPTEDDGTARVVDRAMAAIEAGDEVALPAGVWDALESGANPLKTIRQWRNLTQAELAGEAEISQPTLSMLENGSRTGTVEIWKRLARALQVPVSLLIEGR